jgi:hypothetical protein
LPDNPDERLSDAELDERLTATYERYVAANQEIVTAIDVIKTAQTMQLEAEKSAVARYVEFGGALAALRKRTPKKKWRETTKVRFPKVSDATLTLCQRFWKWRELLREKAEKGPLSIREAGRVINVAKKHAKEDRQVAAQQEQNPQQNQSPAQEPDETPTFEDDAEIDLEYLKDAFIRHELHQIVAAWRTARWTPDELRQIGKCAEELADELEPRPVVQPAAATAST